MKGLIFDIKRFAVHDGPGIRTTIFFKGCPLSCWWCHNPESCSVRTEVVDKIHQLDGKTFTSKEHIGKLMALDEVLEIIGKEAVFYDESGGGVTLSGGEPLLQSEFAIALLESIKNSGYHTALDTCGYVKTETLQKSLAFTDLVLYDLKHHDPEKHKKYTKVDNHLILKNLKFLIDAEKKIRIRIPVIQGINNAEADMRSFIKILKQLKYHGQIDLLPFHNMAGAKYRRIKKENQLSELPDLKKEDLLPAKVLFEREGFVVKIGG